MIAPNFIYPAAITNEHNVRSFKKDVRIIGIYGVVINNFAIFYFKLTLDRSEDVFIWKRLKHCFWGWFYMRANFPFLKALTKMFTSRDLKFEKESTLFNLH